MSKFFPVLIALGLSSPAFAADPLPHCLAEGQTVPINNAQALFWKNSTPNQFHGRAHIVGTLGRIYPDYDGHNHLQAQVGNKAGDTIEIIYNEEFGAIPELRSGMALEACGDYITASSPTKLYPASPDGAILHWLHVAPNGGHDSGYLAIDGNIFGQKMDKAPPRIRQK